VEFLSFILLLIYIGAILILFLFIVMMLQLNSEELKSSKMVLFSTTNILYLILGIKVIIFLYFFNKKICVSLNLFSYEYIKSNEIINVCTNLSLFSGSDGIIFLSLFSQKFYVLQV
jgi:NADH:ubiquinone oxidoreductase subunit 6 (subunit J)